MLSPGEPRDADISFDTTASCMQFLDLAQHRFLVCHAYISDRSNTEIAPHSTLIFTAVTQSHGDNQRSRHTTKITGKTHVNTWLSYSYSAKKCYNAYVRPLTLVHSSNNPIDIYSSVTSVIINSKALLSQWKPRDAAENFDTYRNLQPHRAVLPAIAWHLVSFVLVLTGNSKQTWTEEVVSSAEFTSRSFAAAGEKLWASTRSVSVDNSVSVFFVIFISVVSYNMTSGVVLLNSLTFYSCHR